MYILLLKQRNAIIYYYRPWQDNLHFCDEFVCPGLYEMSKLFGTSLFVKYLDTTLVFEKMSPIYFVTISMFFIFSLVTRKLFQKECLTLNFIDY